MVYPPINKGFKKENNPDKYIDFYALKIFSKVNEKVTENMKDVLNIDKTDRYTSLLLRIIKPKILKHFQQMGDNDKLNISELDDIVNEEILSFLSDF